MLVFSPFICGNPDNTIYLNLSSYIEGFPRLTGLNPLNYYQIGISTTYEFDMWYANFILNNPESYKELIDMMRELYNGNNICVLVNYTLDFSNLLIESLSKFILERYGYISNIIKDTEDIPYLKEGEITVSGLLLLDREFDKYIHTYGDRSLYTEPED